MKPHQKRSTHMVHTTRSTQNVLDRGLKTYHYHHYHCCCRHRKMLLKNSPTLWKPPGRGRATGSGFGFGVEPGGPIRPARGGITARTCQRDPLRHPQRASSVGRIQRTLANRPGSMQRHGRKNRNGGQAKPETGNRLDQSGSTPKAKTAPPEIPRRRMKSADNLFDKYR